MLIKLAGVRPVSCFTARITVSLRSALSWASYPATATPADHAPGTETAGRWRKMWHLRLLHSGSARGSCASRAGGVQGSAVHQGDNLLELARAVAQQLRRGVDTGAGEYPGARHHVASVLVIAARPVMRITAMRRVRRDHDRSFGLQRYSWPHRQRFPLDNRPTELGCGQRLGTAAAPGAAQLQPRQTIVSPEGLGNISGMVLFGLCCGDKPL